MSTYYYDINYVSLCVIMCHYVSLGAQPTPSEKDTYSKVDAVLSKAPGLLEELRSYHGAGETIREVSSCNLVSY